MRLGQAVTTLLVVAVAVAILTPLLAAAAHQLAGPVIVAVVLVCVLRIVWHYTSL